MTDDRRHFTLEFPAPSVPQSINALKGAHHQAWARAMKPWKELAWVYANNVRVRGKVPWGGHRAIQVHVALPFAKGGRRDAHNYTGTVVKAMVDGLVMAQIVPDDTPEWVEVLDPAIVIRQDRLVTITITERYTSRD